MRSARFAMALAVCATALAAFAPVGATPRCTDDLNATISTDGVIGSLEGRYALPDRSPRALVVYAHGYRNRADSWEPHLLTAAADHRVVAVAMDYTGTGPAPDNRGWPARAGAADTIAAARHFLAACPMLRDKPVMLLGVSMGGNISGLAVADGALRANGEPLFTHWIVVEGAVNSLETYLEARALRASSDYVEGAVQDIEAENGGPFETDPDAYREISIVARTQDILDSGVRSVTLVHGFADGLVPYNQSRELAATLRAGEMPVDFFSVARRNGWQDPSSAEDEGGTTIDSYAEAALPPGTNPRPLAGHGWEGSTTHIVIATGFERLWAILEAGDLPAGREFLVDSEAGIIQIG